MDCCAAPTDQQAPICAWVQLLRLENVSRCVLSGSPPPPRPPQVVALQAAAFAVCEANRLSIYWMGLKGKQCGGSNRPCNGLKVGTEAKAGGRRTRGPGVGVRLGFGIF